MRKYLFLHIIPGFVPLGTAPAERRGGFDIWGPSPLVIDAPYRPGGFLLFRLHPRHLHLFLCFTLLFIHTTTFVRQKTSKTLVTFWIFSEFKKKPSKNWKCTLEKSKWKKSYAFQNQCGQFLRINSATVNPIHASTYFTTRGGLTYKILDTSITRGWRHIWFVSTWNCFTRCQRIPPARPLCSVCITDVC